MSKLFEDQLHHARTSYELSRATYVPGTRGSFEAYEAEQREQTQRASSASEIPILTQCAQYCQAALQATRRGEYEIARYLFATTDQLIQASELSPVVNLVIQSGQESAMAYLDYRREDFESGTSRIYHALAIDETLEYVYGMAYFHLHRLRLLLNLIRLKRRQGAREEVFQASFSLLDYLEQKSASLPFPTRWDFRQLESVSSNIKTFFFEEVVLEIVCLTAGQERISETFLQKIEAHTSTLSSICQLSPRAHSWLQAKQALYQQNSGRFLELIHPMITAGLEDIPMLRYGILVDLALLCSQFSLQEANILQQEIAEDMSSWKWAGLPLTWKSIPTPIHR